MAPRQTHCKLNLFANFFFYYFFTILLQDYFSLKEVKLEQLQQWLQLTIQETNVKYSNIEAQKDEEIKLLIEKTKELELITNELNEKNLIIERDFQKLIQDLERQLIDTKLQLALQSSEYEEAKRDIVLLRKQIQEHQTSSESDKASNSPNQSLLNDGQEFSTSQFLNILNEKSMLKDIDISFKNTAIQRNKEFIKNLNAPQALNKMDSLDYFSPEQCNLRVMINPEYDSFPVIERNGSIEIDFIPSPIKCNIENNQGDFQTFALPPKKKQPSIEKYQEQIQTKNKINLLVSQLSPQIMMLGEKEQNQVTKVLEETSTNTALIKTYNNEVVPILNTLYLYSSVKSQILVEKMNNLLRKQPAPQSLRKRIWPLVNKRILFILLLDCVIFKIMNANIKFFSEGLLIIKNLKQTKQSTQTLRNRISNLKLILSQQIGGNIPKPTKIEFLDQPNKHQHFTLCYFKDLFEQLRFLLFKQIVDRKQIENKQKALQKFRKSNDSQPNMQQREDMHRTYPNFSIFDKGSQTNEILQTILEQFNNFRPDIGYVQGMAYPAAILFMYLGDSYLTFKYFNNLIAGNEFISNLYKFKVEKIKLYIKTFDYFLSQKHPKCIQHLSKLHIQSDIFIIEWFYTLYCRAFSFATVAKIWDLMLAQGEVIFYKVAISIFGCIEKELIDKDFDDTLFLIRNCTNKIDPDILIKQVYSQKLTTEILYKKYQKLLEEMDQTEKLQKKKEENIQSLNSSISSTSTQSSANGNSALKYQTNKNDQPSFNNAKDQFLKPPGLDPIEEMNSSTHSASILANVSSDDKQSDENNNSVIIANLNQELKDIDTYKENLNKKSNSNQRQQTTINQKNDSSQNESSNNVDIPKETLNNQNNIQEIIQN